MSSHSKRAIDRLGNSRARDIVHAAADWSIGFRDLGDTSKGKEEFDKLPRDFRQWLDDEGFEHVGTYMESMSPVFPGLPSVSFVDAQGTIRASVRENDSIFFKPNGTMHTFFTFFEDRTALVTWCIEQPKTLSTDRLESLGTTGSIAEDLDRHRQRIEARRRQGIEPLRVESMDDIEATFRHYYRQLMSEGMATNVLIQWVILHLGVPGSFAYLLYVFFSIQ